MVCFLFINSENSFKFFSLALDKLHGNIVSALKVITCQLPVYFQECVDDSEEGGEMEVAISCCHLHSRVTSQSAFGGDKVSESYNIQRQILT